MVGTKCSTNLEMCWPKGFQICLVHVYFIIKNMVDWLAKFKLRRRNLAFCKNLPMFVPSLTI